MKARFKRTMKVLHGELVMSADATIRRLRLDDANSFRAIRLEALKANPDAFGSTFELEDKLDLPCRVRSGSDGTHAG